MAFSVTSLVNITKDRRSSPMIFLSLALLKALDNGPTWLERTSHAEGAAGAIKVTNRVSTIDTQLSKNWVTGVSSWSQLVHEQFWDILVGTLWGHKSPTLACAGKEQEKFDYWYYDPFLHFSTFTFIMTLCCTWKSFSGGSDDKESACNTGDLSLIPGSGRYPGEGNGYPLQYSCLENFMGSGA